MIHVCFGMYDKTGKYSKFVGMCMKSIFENTKSGVTVHILHDNTLTGENRKKFEILVAGENAKGGNFEVKFYNVETLMPDEINFWQGIMPERSQRIFSFGTLYRLLIPKIIPPEIEKIIYLDSDIFLTTDIAELWNVELGEKILAAVPVCIEDPEMPKTFYPVEENLVKSEDYFNAGMLSVNLKAFREFDDKMKEIGLHIAEKFPRPQFDQDILNCLFAADYLKLPVNFNRLVMYARGKENPYTDKKIYHDAGGTVSLDMRDIFSRYYMELFMRTPFFSVDFIGDIYNLVLNHDVALKRNGLSLFNSLQDKTRIFFLNPQTFGFFNSVFQTNATDEYIDSSGQISFNLLLKSLKESGGKKIVFLLVPQQEYFRYRDLLSAEGYRENIDFVNVIDMFLSEETGVPLATKFYMRYV